MQAHTNHIGLLTSVGLNEPICLCVSLVIGADGWAASLTEMVHSDWLFSFNGSVHKRNQSDLL